MINKQYCGRWVVWAVAALTILGAHTAAAATCNVPSTPYPTIQAAIDDGNCTDIVVAAGTYSEAPVIARSLSVQGAGSGQTFIQGQVEITSGAVQLSGLHITASADALYSHSSAEVSGFDVVVLQGAIMTVLFADGFESGTLDAWSASAQ